MHSWYRRQERLKLIRLINKILGGVTRNTLIRAAKLKMVPIVERAFSLKDLLNCEEAFLTSTTVGVLPVTKINNKKIKSGKIGSQTKKLIKIYNEFLENQLV